MGPWELISKLMSLSLPDNHLPDSDTRIVTQVVGGGKKAFVRNAEIAGMICGVENLNVVSFELCLGWQWVPMARGRRGAGHRHLGNGPPGDQATRALLNSLPQFTVGKVLRKKDQRVGVC